MSWKERVHLIDSLWNVLELLQRVNMLADIDEGEFEENNRQCNHIKALIKLLNEGDIEALAESQDLAEHYLGIFSDEDAA